MRPLPAAILLTIPATLAVGAAVNGISRFSSSPATARAAAGVSVGAGDQRQAGGHRGPAIDKAASALLSSATTNGLVNAGAGDTKTGGPDRLIRAIIAIESNNDPRAIGDGGRAVGCLQIWPITVADANRILGREEFALADRLDPDRSRAIFWTITNHYSSGCSDEIKAKRWCNGPRGEHKPGSAAYWAKVQRAMEETR